MLTIKEHKILNKFIAANQKQNKISATLLSSFIDENLVDKSPLQLAFDRTDKRKSIGKVRPDSAAPKSETRKAEIKKGFKVRTAGESAIGDENAKQTKRRS